MKVIGIVSKRGDEVALFPLDRLEKIRNTIERHKSDVMLLPDSDFVAYIDNGKLKFGKLERFMDDLTVRKMVLDYIPRLTFSPT